MVGVGVKRDEEEGGENREERGERMERCEGVSEV
jgi:hypothetical protein